MSAHKWDLEVATPGAVSGMFWVRASLSLEQACPFITGLGGETLLWLPRELYWSPSPHTGWVP